MVLGVSGQEGPSQEQMLGPAGGALCAPSEEMEGSGEGTVRLSRRKLGGLLAPDSLGGNICRFTSLCF